MGLMLSSVLMAAAVAAGTAWGQAPEKPAYPPPAPPRDDSQFGTGIQRTMTLLATSTPTHRHTVKVLFYGQSITEQTWWKMVADDLRQRFPNATLLIENRAIGGFASQVLVKTAEADLYPFYPDLLIFHVYGSHLDYETIIANTRRRTTSEILIQTDHITKDEEINEETDRSKLSPAQWSAWMNHVFLPDVAKKYGAELLDQRAEWRQYLIDNHLPAAALLKDGVHLNDQGNYLMAESVQPHLRYLPNFPDAAWRDLVRTYEVGRDVSWQDGKLVLEFEGNRVDVIAGQGNRPGTPARVLIEGQQPSEFPELYTFSRSSYYPYTGWPGLMRVSSEKPLILEEWSARIKDASDDLSSFKFEVFGSKTGPDGQGTNDKRFVSNSGRIVIDPSDWSIARSREFTGKPMPAGFEVKWKVVPLFVDEYVAPEIKDPTRGTVTTLAQGLSNSRHTLEIIAGGEGTPPIQALRVYRPPVKS